MTCTDLDLFTWFGMFCTGICMGKGILWLSASLIKQFTDTQLLYQAWWQYLKQKRAQSQKVDG